MRLVIPKNLHNSIPPLFRTTSEKNFFWSYEFTLDSTYDLKSEDQNDWNKLIGLKADYFRPMNNSIMVGFRYNVEEKMYELNFYRHVDGKREMTDAVLKVPPNEKFRVSFLRLRGILTLTLTFQEKVVTASFAFPHKRVYLINTWFGGNNASPVNFKLSIKKLC